MATANANGVRIFYNLIEGQGAPLVLVHGSWGSHRNWDAVAPLLGASFRVLAYDRRGHSDSERPNAQGSVREDVADLAALIEHLALAPAWVAGNSFGASIALRLAGERPDLLRGLIVHEPPLLAMLAGDPSTAPVAEEAARRVLAVVERIAAGDHAGAAEQFVETVALGPGAWSQLPPDMRKVFVENAPTFLDEARDPEQLAFDTAWLGDFRAPTLLTKGALSPPLFAPVVAKVAAALPHAKVATFEAAGHIPHATHPELYVDTIGAFIREHN